MLSIVESLTLTKIECLLLIGTVDLALPIWTGYFVGLDDNRLYCDVSFIITMETCQSAPIQ